MKPVAQIDPEKQNLVALNLVLIYLFFEFGRPQNLIPILGKLRLPAFTVLLIGMFVLLSHRLSFKAKQTMMFVLLMLQMMIHGPFAMNNYWAFQMFYVMSVTFIAYCGIVAFVDTYSKFEKLFKYWLFVFIFLAIIGINRKGVGIGGFIGDENDFCMALNMILPFVIFGIFMDKGKWHKIYCISLTLLFLFVIVLTKSRGGFVGLIAVIAYSVLKSNKKLVLSMLIGVFGVFLLIAAPAGYWEEMGTITGEATKKDEHLESQWGTGAQRIYSWKLGWGMFKENPVMGVGQGNYPWHVKDQEEKMKVQWKTRSLGGRAAHSLYFTLLPELGLIGVTLFGLMVWYIWRDLAWIRKCIGKDKKNLSGDYKNIYYYTLAIEASIIGYLFSSIFISTLYYPNFWVMTAVMVALRNIVMNLNGSPVKAEVHPPHETGRIPSW